MRVVQNGALKAPHTVLHTTMRSSYLEVYIYDMPAFYILGGHCLINGHILSPILICQKCRTSELLLIFRVFILIYVHICELLLLLEIQNKSALKNSCKHTIVDCQFTVRYLASLLRFLAMARAAS